MKHPLLASATPLIAALATAFGLLATPAQAQELTGTLKKIKDSGRMVIGVRDASIPFSYLADGNYIGYSVDICDRIASAVQRKLGLAAMQRTYQPVTSANRIPLLVNGTIDVECGSTTNNAARQEQIAYAPTTFVTANRVLTKKAANINSFNDLRGRTIISTAGTTNIRQANELNTSRNLGMTVLIGKDHAESFLMVETDRAAAFVMDDILLAGLAANSKSPGDYVIGKEALSVEPYGIMVRKNDPAFKEVADNTVKGLFSSGDINRIYSKWFLSPIPPKNVNLNWPMTDALRAVIAKPTDSPDPLVYANAIPPAQQEAAKKKK